MIRISDLHIRYHWHNGVRRIRKGESIDIPRKEMLEAVRFVNLVTSENHWDQKVRDVCEYGGIIFVMGNDWEWKLDFLKSACEVTYLPRMEDFSTSDLKAHIRNGAAGPGKGRAGGRQDLTAGAPEMAIHWLDITAIIRHFVIQ